jgi:hypothetical protein
MKNTALPALLCLALLSPSLSHGMSDWNPATEAFHDSALQLVSKARNTDYEDAAVTPIQEFLTLPAPANPHYTLWIFISSHFKQMLASDIRYKTINRTNPQTGNTALGDLITHCHPTHNYVHHMAEHLIDAGARLDNIDGQGNSLYGLLLETRKRGALTQKQYNDIAAKPAVQAHIVQKKQEREARAQGVAAMLGEFLPQALHPTVTGYECGFPK